MHALTCVHVSHLFYSQTTNYNSVQIVGIICDPLSENLISLYTSDFEIFAIEIHAVADPGFLEFLYCI